MSSIDTVMDINDLTVVHSVSVEIRHETLGCLGRGQLTFGNDDAPQVSQADQESFLGFANGHKWSVLRAHADGGQVFTLIDCDSYGSTIYAEYLLVGETTTISFNQIEMRFDEISEWFLQPQRIDGNVGEQLTWRDVSEPITATVQSGRDQLEIRNRYRGHRRRQGEVNRPGF